ncbi:hypothetical protein VP01_2129g3 [Puccinia sorghi]|uniref:Uncharacterized protein n=1 Tax=Puccinia sorghi TaxID=27349 RepID=A0A0L6V9W1_9BASI|nr:hypothetical protein VP01_2129g3 [Puccinia sorghi]
MFAQWWQNAIPEAISWESNYNKFFQLTIKLNAKSASENNSAFLLLLFYLATFGALGALIQNLCAPQVSSRSQVCHLFGKLSNYVYASFFNFLHGINLKNGQKRHCGTFKFFKFYLALGLLFKTCFFFTNDLFRTITVANITNPQLETKVRGEGKTCFKTGVFSKTKIDFLIIDWFLIVDLLYFKRLIFGSFWELYVISISKKIKYRKMVDFLKPVNYIIVDLSIMTKLISSLMSLKRLLVKKKQVLKMWIFENPNQSITKKLISSFIDSKGLLVQNKHVSKRVDFWKPVNYIIVDLEKNGKWLRLAFLLSFYVQFISCIVCILLFICIKAGMFCKKIYILGENPFFWVGNPQNLLYSNLLVIGASNPIIYVRNPQNSFNAGCLGLDVTEPSLMCIEYSLVSLRKTPEWVSILL